MSNHHGMSTFQKLAELSAKMAGNRVYQDQGEELESLSPKDNVLARVARLFTHEQPHEALAKFLGDEAERLSRSRSEALGVFGEADARKFLNWPQGFRLKWFCCWIERQFAEKLNHFGRLFSPGATPTPEPVLELLANQMNEGFGVPRGNIPLGFVFFGQFIDHDITFDAVTQLSDAGVTVENVANLRSPTLDLDNVYRDGPEASPYLYDKDRGTGYLLTANNGADLPRNAQSTALIGDPRNDENTFVSQLHLQFLHFHNGVLRLIENSNVDAVFGRIPGEHDFEFARRLCRWHYQWILVNEYLPLIVDSAPLAAAHSITGVPQGTTPPPPLDPMFSQAEFVLKSQSWTDCCGERRCGTMMPVEFSGAAFRFAHSQVPGRIDINDNARNLPIFVPSPPGPGAFTPAESQVDWRRFFAIDGSSPQMARPIDTFLDAQLFQLPFVPAGTPSSLALRNLVRSEHVYRVPQVGVVAGALGLLPIDISLAATKQLSDAGITTTTEAPLWFAVLGEAAKNGGRLGKIGGLIVAWTLLNILRCDEESYVNASPAWSPVLNASTPGLFTMADLMRIAASERIDVSARP